MRRTEIICAVFILLGGCVWAQNDTTVAPPSQPVPAMGGIDTSADASDARMATPPVVNGQSYPMTLGSQERSNYLRAGLTVTGAYSDNALGETINGHAVTDESYSIAPTIALDTTTSRAHFEAMYAPGYTFYQHTTSRDETDQNATLEFEYRLSPHVTFTARDGVHKTSNVFNQPDAGLDGVSGGAQGANTSVIAPTADQLSNTGTAGITYQYALNGMVGASGTFTYLHYGNPGQVTGLSDGNSQAGMAFFSHRIAKTHYIGATYEYQRLIASPTAGQTETQTHAILGFYTFYPMARMSISLFGGPQYADTLQPTILTPITEFETRSWTPAAGASLGLQGTHTSFALSYMHVISSGGGLGGAVQADTATTSLNQQLTRRLGASVGGGYSQNDMLGLASLGANNGHSITGTASVQQQLGQHVNLQAGYTRLHQSYSTIAVIASTPNTNREFVSISYYFSRPLGR